MLNAHIQMTVFMSERHYNHMIAVLHSASLIDLYSKSQESLHKPDSPSSEHELRALAPPEPVCCLPKE